MTLTPTLRLTEPTPVGDDGVWATYLNSDLVYIDQGINGLLSKSIAGLTTYTLVADGSASDEARYQVYTFTGALAANCTVTIPANAKVGLVRNNTTGGFNVILTTGSGPITIPPDGYFYHILTSGVGVGAFNLGVTGGMNVIGVLSAGSLDLSGGISTTDITASGTLGVTGAAKFSSTGAFTSTVTAADGTAGDQVVNFSQFAPTVADAGHTYLPGGLLEQWGVMDPITGSPPEVTFSIPFSDIPYLTHAYSGNSTVLTVDTYGPSAGGFFISSSATGAGTIARWYAKGPA